MPETVDPETQQTRDLASESQMKSIKPAPSLTLTNQDVEFILQGDYAIRHVSSTAHFEQHKSTIYGDAVPLTGMGRVILDQMAAEGEIPSRRSVDIHTLMENHGDAIRERFEAALAEKIADDVRSDAGGGVTHLMIVKGMENSQEGVALKDNGYPYGKCGKQIIKPEQIVASMNVTVDDLDGMDARGGVAGVLTEKVKQSIQGMNTADAGLVSRVPGRLPGDPQIQNSLADQRHDRPENSVFAREALRETIFGETPGSVARLDALAAKALAEDPAAMLETMGNLSATGNAFTGNLDTRMARWAGQAFDRLGSDPGLAFSAADNIGQKTVPGSPLFEASQKALVNASAELSAQDPVAGLKNITYIAQRMAENDPQLPAVMQAYVHSHDAAARQFPAETAAFIDSQLPHIREGSRFGTLIAAAGQAAEQPLAYGVVAAESSGPLISDRAAKILAKAGHAVDGAASVAGSAISVSDAIDAAREGDISGTWLNAANATAGVAGTIISTAKAAGQTFAPVLEGAVSKANIATTGLLSAYEVAKEEGNFIDTASDGSKSLGNKGEKAVAMGATLATAGGLAAAGVGSGGIVPATIAVTVAGDAVIEQRRSWKEMEASVDEYNRPSENKNSIPDRAAGLPDYRQYGHISGVLRQVSGDMDNANLAAPLDRDGGNMITPAGLGKLDMSNPKNIAEFERALDINIRRQQGIVADTGSVLPDWARYDDKAGTHFLAGASLGSLQAAKTELQWYKQELQAVTFPAVAGPAVDQKPVETASADTPAKEGILPRKNRGPSGPG